MSEYPKNISNEDLIRRLKDKINGHKHQIEQMKMSNKEISNMNSKLLEFMKRNDLFSLYHKQANESNRE